MRWDGSEIRYKSVAITIVEKETNTRYRVILKITPEDVRSPGGTIMCVQETLVCYLIPINRSLMLLDEMKKCFDIEHVGTHSIKLEGDGEIKRGTYTVYNWKGVIGRLTEHKGTITDIMRRDIQLIYSFREAFGIHSSYDRNIVVRRSRGVTRCVSAFDHIFTPCDDYTIVTSRMIERYFMCTTIDDVLGSLFGKSGSLEKLNRLRMDIEEVQRKMNHSDDLLSSNVLKRIRRRLA